MNTLEQKKEDKFIISEDLALKYNSIKNYNKERIKEKKTPLIKCLNLIDKTSFSYVLGYN